MFTLAGRPQRLGDAIRPYWNFGPPAKPDAVSGMDFIILSDGKVRALYAFVDAPTQRCFVPPTRTSASGRGQDGTDGVPATLHPRRRRKTDLGAVRLGRIAA